MIFLILIIASVVGFMILNFPMGWIFLGDGGAYALGHLLVWSAIILSNTSIDVSPFAILLILPGCSRYWFSYMEALEIRQSNRSS